MFKNVLGWIKTWWENRKDVVKSFVYPQLRKQKPLLAELIGKNRPELLKMTDLEIADWLVEEGIKIIDRQM